MRTSQAASSHDLGEIRITVGLAYSSLARRSEQRSGTHIRQVHVPEGSGTANGLVASYGVNSCIVAHSKSKLCVVRWADRCPETAFEEIAPH
ncbi:MAG: hypothetical protein ABSA59_09570 [Terriglobia bacterium]